MVRLVKTVTVMVGLVKTNSDGGSSEYLFNSDGGSDED